jgi:hypothetical protein
VGKEGMLKVSGPNLGEAFIHIVADNSRWRAGLRLTAEGADVATTEETLDTPQEAWAAAFELFRSFAIH